MLSSSNSILYLSYALANKVQDSDLITVDCHYHRGLVLSHSNEPRVPEKLRSNTSTECALKWISLSDDAKREISSVFPQYVTCNHWDIDGFLAVWSIIHPSIAQRHSEELIAAAELGDFRSFDPDTGAGQKALKICAVLNKMEHTTFCLPFGDLMDATIEYEIAEKKFGYFLPRFAQWLEKIDDYESLWRAEYDEVMSDIAVAKSNAVVIEEASNLTVIKTDKPLHYYASFNAAKSGAVLTLLPGQHYAELEYKYETLVGKTDRKSMKRVDLTHLAQALTQEESTPGVHWVFDQINEGGPMLRPEKIDARLSRELRYQNIAARLELSDLGKTGIKPERITALVSEALAERVAEAA